MVVGVQTLVCLLGSCVEIDGEEDNNQFVPQLADIEQLKKDEIRYDGHIVKLELLNENRQFLEQSIEVDVEDITIRAKRIDSESYLLNKGVEESKIAEAMETIEGEQLFSIEFEEVQKQNLMKKYFSQDMDAPISYLSFKINKDFRLVTELGDTIRPSYSIYERNFHVAPYERILLSFNNIEETESIKLIYNDRLFEKGRQTFSFPGHDYVANHIITKTDL